MKINFVLVYVVVFVMSSYLGAVLLLSLTSVYKANSLYRESLYRELCRLMSRKGNVIKMTDVLIQMIFISYERAKT